MTPLDSSWKIETNVSCLIMNLSDAEDLNVYKEEGLEDGPIL